MTQYVQNSHCEATMLDDEWLVLNTDTFTVTKLNDVGGFCWSMLCEARTTMDLVQAVMGEFAFDEPRESVQKDLEEFLEALIQCGCVSHVH